MSIKCENGLPYDIALLKQQISEMWY